MSRSFAALLFCLAVLPYGCAHAESWEELLKSGREALRKSYPWESEKLLTQCLKQAEQELPADDPRLAEVLVSLGELYLYMGAIDRSEPVLIRALKIQEAKLDADAGELVDTLLQLGEVSNSRGEYNKAEAFDLRALAIAEKKYADQIPHTDCLYYLESVYTHARRYAEAATLCRRSISIKTTRHDAPDDICNARVRLIELQLKQQLSLEADAQAEALLKDLDETFKDDPIRHARLILTLGEAYRRAGRWDNAAAQLKRALALADTLNTRTDSEYHTLCGYILLGYGICLNRQMKYEEAEQMLKRALGHWEIVRAPPRLIDTHRALAELYVSQDKNTQAEAEFLESLHLHEKWYGWANPNIGHDLNDIARLMVRQQRYWEAEVQFRRQIKVLQRSFAPDSPTVMYAQVDLAFTHIALGRYADGLQEYRDALAALARARGVLFATYSEEAKLGWLNDNRFVWDQFFSAVLEQQREEQTSGKPEAVFDAILSYTGAALDASSLEQEAAITSGDPELSRLAKELADIRKRTAALYMGGPQLDKNAVVRGFQDLNARRNALGVELARMSHPFAEHNKLLAAGVKDVQAALSPETALITVVKSSKKPAQGVSSVNHYLAMVVHHESLSALIDLGPADAIDAAAAQYGDACALAVQTIQNKGEAAATADLDALGANVSRLVLKPLAGELNGSTRWVLALDGALTTVAFNILPLPDGGGRIVDRYEVVYVNHPREVVRFTADSVKSNTAMILAGPDFDGAVAVAADLKTPDTLRTARLKDVRWRDLPGTREEAAAIHTLLKEHGIEVILKTGADATKLALAEVHAPRFLHIATHGFYLPESIPKDTAKYESRGIAGLEPSAIGNEPAKQWFAFIGCPNCGRIHDPLMRSGLILAGANKVGLADSMMTSRELLGVNLFGTELVVLSACETGLGVVTAGEGVMGMRRSFLNSGASSLVTSLWKVPDQETKDLMTLFYQKKLSGTTTSAALRQAMLESRDARMKSTGAAHPYFWSAFILVGNPN